MTKLTKKELTKPLRVLEQQSVYEVVFSTWGTSNMTRRLAVQHEIDAARTIREQYSNLDTIKSITLTSEKVWA